MKLFTQLSLKERESLYMGQVNGKSIRKISQELCREPSTVSRELRRNKQEDVGYLPDRAQLLAEKRKYVLRPKLDRYPDLKKYILKKLNDLWSPSIIAGRLKRAIGGESTISAETIYQFIYGNEGQSLKLYKLLAKARPRRGIKNGRTPRGSQIPDRVSIHDQPIVVTKREEIGHFEGDLTFFKGNQSANISVVLERQSRFVLLKKNNSKQSCEVVSGIFNMLSQLPYKKRKSITFDNGKEFTKHGLLKNHLNVRTFFCDKHAPWQKGQVENFNAFLHRFIPKKTSLKCISEPILRELQHMINNRPRKCLKFRTPSEVFGENLC